MINLREEEKKYISKKKIGKLEKDTATYYFKESLEDGIELVIERIASLLDIKCPHYEQIIIKNKRYYLSKMVGKGEEFYTFSDFNLKNKSLYDIWINLESIYPRQVEYLMKQIIKIYLLDILVLNPDRNHSNIGVYFKNGNICDIYILDNECSFYDERKPYITSKLDAKDKLNSHKIVFVRGIPSIEKNMEELEYFLATSSSEFIDLFKNMYDMLSPEVVRSIFERIELEENRSFYMKEDYLQRYSKNYNAIRKLLIGRGLVRTNE